MSNNEGEGPLGYLFDELYKARRARPSERNSVEADVLKVLDKNEDKPVQINNMRDNKRYGYAQQPIHAAAELGFAEVVKKLIDRGANVNTTISMAHVTPVFNAIQQGKLNTLKVLVENGAKTEGLEVYEYDLNKEVPALVSLLLCCRQFFKTTIAYYVKRIDPDEIEKSIKILKDYYDENGSESVKHALKAAISFLPRSRKNKTMREFKHTYNNMPPSSIMRLGGIEYQKAEEEWKKHLKGGRTRRLRRARS
jgi:hypothetical protein